MRFHRRKLATHAVALWLLVVVGAVGFAGLVGYLATLSRLEAGRPSRLGAREDVRLPTLLGTVTAVEPDGFLRVDSKQAFRVIRLSDDTDVTALGGGRIDPKTIGVGALVTATGHDLGDGQMLARAVVVLKTAGDAASPATPIWTERLEDGPSALEAWAAEPLLGWFSPMSDEAAFAIKAYDPAAKAASVEIYGLDGRIAERIELDVPGLVRLKRGNPFLKPGEAAAAILAKSRAFAPAETGRIPASRAGLSVLAPSVGAAGRYGMAIRAADGREVEAIAPSDIGFRNRVEDPGLIRAWWSFSPDGDRLAAVYAYLDEDGSRPRSVHLIDLEELGL